MIQAEAFEASYWRRREGQLGRSNSGRAAHLKPLLIERAASIELAQSELEVNVRLEELHRPRTVSSGPGHHMQ